MAERRMFAKTIIDSDAFLEMPLSTQALYFHLGMRADDDGFVNSPKKIQRSVGAAEDDLRILVSKNFIIPFESGVVVIKHWNINNYIQNDRYHPTAYVEEKRQLYQKDNRSYSLLDTECIQNGYRMDTQNRLDKKRIDNNIYIGDSEEQKPSIDDFFETIWKAYPKKKGKGQISKAKKTKLYNIGEEQILRCIERYVKEIKEKGIAEQYIMYGSTFFNSGYVDYLDENYMTDDEKPEKKDGIKWQ